METNSLLSRQSLFVKDIMSPGATQGHYVATIGDAQQLLKVYRANVLGSLIKALQITYPKVAQVLGESAFLEIATSYGLANPPTEGCLDQWGGSFSDYFKSSHPYLADLATFEWMKSQSFLEAEPTVLGPNDLQQLVHKGWEDWRVTVNPTLFMMESNFDLRGILDFADGDAAAMPTPLEKKTYLLCVRQNSKLQLFWMSKVPFLFLSSLREGESAIQAFDKNPEIQLPEILNFGFSNGLFIEIKEG